ncbi:putative gustatory receptor 94a [Drosophila willistoni]|nr:putative gustatory receptor 94a [Drosophila willistoni]
MSFLTDILRRRKKGDDHFVFLLTVTLVVLLSVFGLFPITYSPRSRERFQFSIKHLIYCMLVTILFASVYVRQMYQDYIHNQLNLQDATKLYSYMNVIVTVVNYITQMVMGRQVARMMRRVPLFSTLR